MIHDGHEALVVDPGEAAPVQQALAASGLNLSAILVTHRHLDHIGGLQALRRPDLPIYGPHVHQVPAVTHPVGEGDQVRWRGLRFDVIEVPGHTSDHIAYWLPQGLGAQQAPLAMVGDTLFSAGCGRVFDGSLEQLYDSLQRIAAWPDDTLLCATHEYTLANLRFAQAVEPHNPELSRYQARCEALRSQQSPTLPSTLRTERAISPFLRCTQSDVVATALQHGAEDAQPQAVFAALRLWKDRF